MYSKFRDYLSDYAGLTEIEYNILTPEVKLEWIREFSAYKIVSSLPIPPGMCYRIVLCDVD
jgi:hypothetical protein